MTVAVTQQAVASLHSHHTWSAVVQPVCRIRLTTVQRIIDFALFGLGGLTPWPKFTKTGNNLLTTYVYHPTKYQSDRENGLRDIHYQSFSLIGLDF